ncbi:MAG: nicotinate-nucleotide--dimethylbenzimidazole phosphoribosyltransferase [Thiotrichales bacterium]|nr:nicotinate-nucleotide--dimethylbenzimidazole phosphoribosyltransferase [Thiotrichales bacterium]
MIENIFCVNQELHDETIAKVLQQQHLTGLAEGALGRLDELVLKLASHQQTDCPSINSVWVALFAADHGVAVEEVSEFEATQSSQWVVDLCSGRAVSNVLIKEANAAYEIIDVGLNDTLSKNEHFVDAKIANGTQNFVTEAAMTQAQLIDALEVGIAAAERAKEAGADLFVSGELGVANTTSALAMTAVLSGKPVMELLEIGKKRVMRSERHKAEVIEKALALHQEHLTSPLKILQHLGGFETAALCGAYIRCAQLGITIVVDGLMSTVAAWIADLVSRNDQLMHCKSVEMLMDLGKYSVPETLFCICGNCPRLVEWCFFSHQSAEKFHAMLLEILAVDPILQFDMKLGQASGALMVLPLLKQACSIHAHLVAQQPELKAIPVDSECPFDQPLAF